MQENVLESAVCKLQAILCRPQCVNTPKVDQIWSHADNSGPGTTKYIIAYLQRIPVSV